ncbi:hypothetical protein BZA70DRAFT_81385 [Myxozyma melibiosi]|uniref:Inner kinetochore subunit AME1 domain-containing protein n=1 Tax=Myxozyma melibiosi TaxID=54550 RepID=A0ABR1EZQ7_9ASCO
MDRPTGRNERLAARIRGSGARKVTESMFSISYTRNVTPKAIHKGGSQTMLELNNARKTPQLPASASSGKKVKITPRERSSVRRSTKRRPVVAAADTPAKTATATATATPASSIRKVRRRSTAVSHTPVVEEERPEEQPSYTPALPDVVTDRGSREESIRRPRASNAPSARKTPAPTSSPRRAPTPKSSPRRAPAPKSSPRRNPTPQQIPARRAQPTQPVSRPKTKSTTKPQTSQKVKKAEHGAKGARVLAFKLPRKGGRGASYLSGVDVVTRVTIEQLTTASLVQPEVFNRRVIETYTEEVEARLMAMCDAVDTHGILSRATRKSDRKVYELRERLLELRSDRQKVQDQITTLRESYLKKKSDLISEGLVQDVLEAVGSVKTRAAHDAESTEEEATAEDATDKRVGVVAQLSRIAPLVCGEYGVLGRLREFNDMLEAVK